MMTHAEPQPTSPQGTKPRLRATIYGVGFDGPADGPRRIVTGDQCLMVGGSAETHAEMVETMLRLEGELERIGRPLAELPPEDLAELALRIDSPELHEIAVAMADGLERRGWTFEQASAEQRNALVAAMGR